MQKSPNLSNCGSVAEPRSVAHKGSLKHLYNHKTRLGWYEKLNRDQKNAPLPGKSECPVADLLVFMAVVGERREGRFWRAGSQQREQRRRAVPATHFCRNCTKIG